MARRRSKHESGAMALPASACSRTMKKRPRSSVYCSMRYQLTVALAFLHRDCSCDPWLAPSRSTSPRAGAAAAAAAALSQKDVLVGWRHNAAAATPACPARQTRPWRWQTTRWFGARGPVGGACGRSPSCSMAFFLPSSGRSLRLSTTRRPVGSCLAVGESSVILLHPPLPFSRCYQ